MLGLGTGEIIAIILVIVLLFGATRLPQLAKSLGQSRKAFKEGMREAEGDETAEHSQISSNAPTPQISNITDEELLEEMRRRTESKT